MQCIQIKKDGERCKNTANYGCKTCRYHGAHVIRTGRHAPNYKNGNYTKEAYETRRRLRVIHFIGNVCGFIKRKLRGRKINIGEFKL